MFTHWQSNSVQLTIDHKAIKRALVWATRKRRPLPDAVLSFDQGMARVQLGPIDAEIPASGHWPLIAHFPGNWLRAVVKTPPADGVLCITFQGGRIVAGGFSAPAELRYPLPEESFEAKLTTGLHAKEYPQYISLCGL